MSRVNQMEGEAGIPAHGHDHAGSRPEPEDATRAGREEVERLLMESESARTALDEANERLQQAGIDLQKTNEELQRKATELETANAELAAANDALQNTAVALEERTVEAEASKLAAELARSEADAANQAKSAFLATMSHELRTPINAMIGYTQLIDLGLAGPLTEQQRDYLTRLSRSSQHLLGLVNDILDLAKIDSGEMQVAREPRLASDAVAAAIDLVAPQATVRGVRLDTAPGETSTATYLGDEHRVLQILVNLLTNAVKFTPSGGSVVVSTGTATTAPPSATRLRGPGPWVFIRVEDTGIGIAASEQARIFDPFVQVESGHTRTQGGTGLGLSISRRLARIMGGDILVESKTGAGSAFTVWLCGRNETGAESANETAAARGALAERQLGELGLPHLDEIGDMLRDSVLDVLNAYVERIRTDPVLTHGHHMRRPEIEDHAASLFADLAQSLVIVSNAGEDAAEMLKDGTAIQRTISDAHGARRFLQGWTEADVARDVQILREEVERTVRSRVQPLTADADVALGILLGLIDRAQAISVSAWRRAADGFNDTATHPAVTR